MRKAAIGILEDEMSEYTLEHIREIDYLEEWIVDAMIKFHESEVKKLNIPAVSNNEVAVCSRCGLNTVSHPTKLCYKCWIEVG